MSLIRHKTFTAFHTQFHQRHGHLRDVHVRALAWLLTAPNLLDATAARWHGAIVLLNDYNSDAWLTALDADPADLHAAVDARRTARLGLYAEKLLGFYLRQNGRLFATNIQVRAGANATIGEFDYLLFDPNGAALMHWEFATKFYLLESQRGLLSGAQADCFVGPNLADTLGAKMGKIMDRQLQLSRHPAAQPHLPMPVSQAQALVKGWLFYRDPAVLVPAAMGVAPDHCRGFWCTGSELAADVAAERSSNEADVVFAILPRLQWLAPAALPMASTLSSAQLQIALAASFATDPAPLLIAVIKRQDGQRESAEIGLECSRGFVVPDDWHAAAEKRVQDGMR